MLFLLSPAKSLDFDTPTPADLEPSLTRAQFLDDSAALIDLLRAKSVPEIRELMDLSEPLAQLNADRYRDWRPRFTPRNSKPAILAFNGDVYDGLDAKSLSPEDLAWAQTHVRMLSGLYGILRPLDRMQPYRLEMGTRLDNPHGTSLYAYWGDRLAQHLNKLARSVGPQGGAAPSPPPGGVKPPRGGPSLSCEQVPVIVNLASQEYFRAVDRAALKPRVIECQFEDWKNDGYKVISFFAKRARGLMARYAIEQRLASPDGLRHFKADGYALDATVSTPERLVFRRRLAP
jgi:hypothetical protein